MRVIAVDDRTGQPVKLPLRWIYGQRLRDVRVQATLDELFSGGNRRHEIASLRCRLADPSERIVIELVNNPVNHRDP